VPDEDLDRANGALGAADNMTTLLGTALGGVAVAAVGAGVLLVGNAVSFALSGALLLGVHALAGAPAARREGEGFATRIRVGLVAVRRSPALRVVAVAWSIVGLSVGIHNALLVPLLRGTLEARPDVVGVVAATAAVGLLLGTVAGGRVLSTDVASYPLVLAALGTGMVATGLAPVAAAAAGALLLMGVANGVAIVHNRSGVQRAAHPSQRAGLFALIVGSSSLAIALGAALAGTAGCARLDAGAFVAAGGLVVLVAAPLAVVLARSDPTGLAAASMTAADSAAGPSRGTAAAPSPRRRVERVRGRRARTRSPARPPERQAPSSRSCSRPSTTVRKWLPASCPTMLENSVPP
jgi:hypothetical protein